MNRLQNKIAIITGASDGIGLKVSQAFAQEGAVVAMLARGEDKLRAASDAINAQGHATLALPCDVSSTQQMQAAFATVLEKYGRIDVLLNNAAVAIPGDITDDSDEEWNKLLNINLLGVFRGIKYALPSMLKQGKGSIINMASVQGERSWDHWTTYAAAKGAIKAATRQLAGQYGKKGVRFNTISPGAIDTPMNQKRAETEGPELYEMYQRMHALGRMGEADEVNGACVFLASDESSFVTGIDLTVDGGLLVLPRE
jgi:NAD(P)-dependent dehydrogenase (short-subunit alcohol dehydrogenase family)